MLVVGQSPQQVQLDLLGGRILFLQRLLKQSLEVTGLSAVLELLDVTVHTPLPHLIVNQHQPNYIPIYPRYSKIIGFLFANSSYSWFYGSRGGFGENELKNSAAS